jgi:hypothetical protein
MGPEEGLCNPRSIYEEWLEGSCRWCFREKYFVMFCSPISVKRQSKSLRGSGDGSAVGETERGLMMRVSTLTIKHKNLTD